MFTGIVQGLAAIVAIEEKNNLRTFTVELPDEIRDGLSVGASVAINGVCITATSVDGGRFTFDAIAETLNVTNLGRLKQGSQPNVERSFKTGAEVGGHILSGHIYDMAEVINIEEEDNNKVMRFAGKKEWMKFLFHKGFIALDGCSLTLSSVDKKRGEFEVSLIPETLRRTNFGTMVMGDKINVEIDSQTQIIVETVEQILEERLDELK